MTPTPIFDALTLEALDNFNETIPCACATPPWHCTQPATHRAVISNHDATMQRATAPPRNDSTDTPATAAARRST